MEEFVHTSDESDHRWAVFTRRAENRFVAGRVSTHGTSCRLEVQYDAQRDAKEQHEAKMKEVRKVEELRKEKEAESKRTTVPIRPCPPDLV